MVEDDVKPQVYIVGSLRNQRVIEVTNQLEAAGFHVFSDWFGAGETADDSWAAYEKARGRTYREALVSPAAQNVFWYDVKHLRASDFVVLLGPAGKSGHLEVAYAAGFGIPTFTLTDEPEPQSRWDVMNLFIGPVITDEDVELETLRVPHIAYSIDELIHLLQVEMVQMSEPVAEC